MNKEARFIKEYIFLRHSDNGGALSSAEEEAKEEEEEEALMTR